MKSTSSIFLEFVTVRERIDYFEPFFDTFPVYQQFKFYIIHGTAHYYNWYHYHLKFLISALLSLYALLPFLTYELDAFPSAVLLIVLFGALSLSFYFFLQSKDTSERFRRLYYTRCSDLRFRPHQSNPLNFLVSIGKRRQKNKSQEFDWGEGRRGELKPVRREAELEARAVQFLEENQISQQLMERCMDLVFFYVRDHIVKRLFGELDFLTEKMNSLLKNFDIELDWRRKDGRFVEEQERRLKLEMSELGEFLKAVQIERDEFSRSRILKPEVKNQRVQHLVNRVLEKRPGRGGVIAQRDVLLNNLAYYSFELLLLYRFFTLPKHAMLLYDISFYVKEMAKEIAGASSLETLQSRRGKLINEEWRADSELPTYTDVIAHFFACYLDNNCADRNSLQPLSVGQSVLQYGGVGGYESRAHSSSRQLKIVCEKEREHESYFYLQHGNRRIETIPGTRSIFCAIVHFLNIVKKFQDRVYRGIDLSEMIEEVIEKAKQRQNILQRGWR